MLIVWAGSAEEAAGVSQPLLRKTQPQSKQDIPLLLKLACRLVPSTLAAAAATLDLDVRQEVERAEGAEGSYGLAPVQSYRNSSSDVNSKSALYMRGG